MPHSAGQRREKSTGRRGSKSSRPQRAVGVCDIKELLSLKSGTTQQSLRMSSRHLAVPSLHSSEHSTDLGTHRVPLVKSQLAWTRGSPRQRQTLWMDMQPGFTHGGDTTLPLTAMSVFAINANQPRLPVSHIACLNEKNPPPYAKKI